MDFEACSCVRIACLLLAVHAVSGSSRPVAGEWLSGYSENPDRVTNLPGQPEVEFSHYAGYVPSDSSKGSMLFYWFVEATVSPREKPLLLWLNGGPGCSSIAYGASEELGPFITQPGKPELALNPSSWNSVANLLFLEAPVGVGFSYSNTTSVMDELGDSFTAEDTYRFLLNWFMKYPQYKDAEFYIAGESYAGHFVPQLAEMILRNNEKARPDQIINLSGIALGNPLLDSETDYRGMVDFAYSHSLISREAYGNILNRCDFSSADLTPECLDAMSAYDGLQNIMDVYSIYTPKCVESDPMAKCEDDDPLAYHPCAFKDKKAYFNRLDTQQALHVTITDTPRAWDPCNADVYQKWNERAQSVLPTLRTLLANKIPVWLFSGNADARLPTVSTVYALEKLGIPITRDRHPWYTKEQEFGGFQETYAGGLNFVVVMNAGHDVPTFRRPPALDLITHFLSNRTMPEGKGMGSHSSSAHSKWIRRPGSSALIQSTSHDSDIDRFNVLS